jgi:two-component system OmpR family response regulator
MEKTQKDKSKEMKILIVDDNEQITKMLSTFLELKEHQCTIANDGNEGLKQIKANNYDVILLDLAMPEFDGYSVIKNLEESDTLKDHKIIVFTASTITQEELENLVKRGVTAYLLKPIDIDLLHSKLVEIADL